MLSTLSLVHHQVKAIRSSSPSQSPSQSPASSDPPLPPISSPASAMALSPPTLCALSQRQGLEVEAGEDVGEQDRGEEGAGGAEERREEGGGGYLDAGGLGERESSPLVLGTPPPDT
jgi:hypothetical protein